MSVRLEAWIEVREDGSLTGQLEGRLRPGRHRVQIIENADFEDWLTRWYAEFPYADTMHWNPSVSLRRED